MGVREANSAGGMYSPHTPQPLPNHLVSAGVDLRNQPQYKARGSGAKQQKFETQFTPKRENLVQSRLPDQGLSHSSYNLNHDNSQNTLPSQQYMQKQTQHASKAKNVNHQPKQSQPSMRLQLESLLEAFKRA